MSDDVFRGDPVPSIDDLESSADVMTARESHGAARDDLDLAIAYAHTPWIEERAASMARLMARVKNEQLQTRGGGFLCHEEKCFNERMPNHLWSDIMWRWALSTGATHALFLQDDVVIAPKFFSILHAMICEPPARDRVVALHLPSPRARDVFREGRTRWVASRDGLVGFAYVMSRAKLEAFLEWKDTKLAARAAERTSEDSLIDAWALDAGEAILHPVPTIVDHDLELASTYGNDRHTERRPLVTWRDVEVLEQPLDLTDPVTWRTTPVPIGRVFPKSHWVLRAVLADEQRGRELAAGFERMPHKESPWIYE